MFNKRLVLQNPAVKGRDGYCNSFSFIERNKKKITQFLFFAFHFIVVGTTLMGPLKQYKIENQKLYILQRTNLVICTVI